MRSKRFTLTATAQAALRMLPAVAACSSRTVTYTAAFKQQALGAYAKGISPREIFMQAQIPLKYFGVRHADEKIRAWRSLVQQHGEKYLTQEHRGVKGKENLRNYHDRNTLYKTLSIEEKMVFLEAENEMLRYGQRPFTTPQAIAFVQNYRLGQKELS